MLIILPNSKLDAITTTDQKLPENNRAIPLTEKNAEQEAIKIADKNNKIVNIIHRMLHLSNQILRV